MTSCRGEQRQHLPPLDVQQHSLAFVNPPSETVNIQRVKQSCLSSSQTTQERILSTQFCFRTLQPFPHDNSPRGQGGVGWGGGPLWCWNGSTPGFSFDSCSCVVISQPARTCIRELRWYYRDKVSRGQRKSPPDEEDVCVNHQLFATSSSSRWKTFHLAHSNFFFLVYLQYTHSSTFL